MRTFSTRIGSGLAAVLFLTGYALAQNTTDVVGTWLLVSSVTENDGKVKDQFGAHPDGMMMMLDAAGRFMLTIIGAGLQRFASNNRATGTPEENKAVVGKSIALLGTYSIDAGAKILTFKIAAATFPNWNATEQKRSIILLDQDELKYTTAQASGGGTATVTWKRAK